MQCFCACIVDLCIHVLYMPYLQFVEILVCMHVCIYVHALVSWCGGALWVDQRKKCADICDVAQVTDTRTLPN